MVISWFIQHAEGYDASTYSAPHLYFLPPTGLMGNPRADAQILRGAFNGFGKANDPTTNGGTNPTLERDEK